MTPVVAAPCTAPVEEVADEHGGQPEPQPNEGATSSRSPSIGARPPSMFIIPRLFSFQHTACTTALRWTRISNVCLTTLALAVSPAGFLRCLLCTIIISSGEDVERRHGTYPSFGTASSQCQTKQAAMLDFTAKQSCSTSRRHLLPLSCANIERSTVRTGVRYQRTATFAGHCGL